MKTKKMVKLNCSTCNTPIERDYYHWKSRMAWGRKKFYCPPCRIKVATESTTLTFGIKESSKDIDY